MTQNETTKPTNPKDLIGSGKLPLHLWPETATALGSLGLLDGMLKYGRTNWRVAGVRASIYVDAAKRHLNFYFEGEDNDPDSGLPHLAHALACLAILVDAKAAGKLNDDRQVAGGYRALMTELTPHVARLKELHAAKDPKHYTIADSAPKPEAAIVNHPQACKDRWGCPCAACVEFREIMYRNVREGNVSPSPKPYAPPKLGDVVPMPGLAPVYGPRHWAKSCPHVGCTLPPGHIHPIGGPLSAPGYAGAGRPYSSDRDSNGDRTDANNG